MKVKQMIKDEYKGYKHYIHCADKATTQDDQEFWMGLANDEKSHFQALCEKFPHEAEELYEEIEHLVAEAAELKDLREHLTNRQIERM